MKINTITDQIKLALNTVGDQRINKLKQTHTIETHLQNICI